MIIALQTLVFFRESLLTALDRLLSPYYRKLYLAFNRKRHDSDDDDSEEQVFADFDDTKGVVFYPPVYTQRYAAVLDCILDERWCGKLIKVVDFGYNDISFIKHLTEVPGIESIMGVDLETVSVHWSTSLLGCPEFAPMRDNPLQITLYQGNAADPDYRLIGCDAVIAIEMIEHMLPQDLERLVHNVFGFIKPWVAIFTTPNGDFNVLFNSLEKNGLRRMDHYFEWSREQFHDWCSNIISRYPQYSVSCKGVGPGPPGTQHLGCCSQMAIFVANDYHKQQNLDLNSLSIVAEKPSRYSLSEIIAGFDTHSPSLENVVAPTKLNCTMVHVTRFSKETQDLMSRVRSDKPHAREVVADVHELTKKLKYKRKNGKNHPPGCIWFNFNWGENAPYWNQYYKIAREYNYPCLSKPDECRILDLISNEINRLIDLKKGDQFLVEDNILEIPLEYLMGEVDHLTDDMNYVLELLLWNGYEVNETVLRQRRVNTFDAYLELEDEGDDVSDVNKHT